MPSVLVSTLSHVPPLSDEFPDDIIFTVYLGVFSDNDLTDQGTNDTVFIDFAFVEGPTPPRTIRLDTKTRTSWSIAFINDLPISDEPFTIAIPFDGFNDRVGQAIRPDFSDAATLELRAYTGGLYDFEPDEGWRFGIDAIRVGPAVPEPSVLPMSLLCFIPVMAAARNARSRRARTP